MNASAPPLTTDHPLQPFWDLAVAPIKTRALQTALDHRLFEHLIRPASAAAVADALQLSTRHTSLWLELLWSMQLLTRSAAAEPLYASSALATRYFSAGSADSCREAWYYRAGFLDTIGAQLPSFVADGRAAAPLPAASGGASTWAQAAQVQIGQEQRAVSVPLALALLQRRQLLHDGQRVLDLGGGPGWLAIAIARQYRNSHAVVFDLPDTVAVAAANIAACGLQQQVAVRAGNLDQDAIGEGYDLIWCASVLHFLRDPAAAVQRMRAALRPGGTLLIVQAERSGESGHDLRVLPFYLPMQLRGSYVPAPGQTRRMLEQAGFDRIEQEVVHGFPMAPLTLYRGVAA